MFCHRTSFLRSVSFVAALLVGCGSDPGSQDAGQDAGGVGGDGAGGGSGTSSGVGGSGAVAGSTSSGGGAPHALASKYPGDVGIENDPAVVWVENFEAVSVSAVASRYEEAKNQAGMTLVADVPAKSSGATSMRMRAGGDASATDLYKNLANVATDLDEIFVRYYVKYASGAQYHHTGVSIGGYNPATNWPNPQAGNKPNGDDRFSFALEPIEGGANPRIDFYSYWMKMHSWQDNPSGPGAYYGNTLIHREDVRSTSDHWMCIELHSKVNPNPSSGDGAELGLWIDDQSVIQFTDSAPLGYWIKDKFCPENADSPTCTDFTPQNPSLVPLDLQVRSTTALRHTYLWTQNYVSGAIESDVYYDDMVVATTRIGCLQ
jgi:hypothetical protein